MKIQSFFQLALTCFCAGITLQSVQAQLTGISIDPVITHDGSIEGVPAGYTTYRIYANLTNEYDFVSAVFGDVENPMSIQCTGDILQVAGGGLLGQDINTAFFPFFPAIEYDSWLTIDAMFAGDGVGIVATAVPNGIEAFNDFENGEGFLVNDPFGASWFTAFPCPDPMPDLAACADGKIGFAGTDLKVLLAQITTDGDLSGIFNVQVFPNGIQADQQLASGLNFSSIDGAVFGCTDANATNYNPSATVDDESCLFPCTLELLEDGLNVVPPLCAGDNTGAIQIDAAGAQGADDFYLDVLGGQSSNFGNFSDLLSGPYMIYVVDGAGCIDSLEVVIPATPPLDLTVELTPVSCHDESDGVITITSTTGGSGDYLYFFSGTGEISSTTVYEGLGWTNTNGAIYQFQVVDAATGCVSQALPSTTQPGAPGPGVWVPNPQELFIGLSPVPSPVVDATCADTQDGQIYLVALGGPTESVGPFEYSVDGENYGPSPLLVAGGTYTVTVRDPVGCTAALQDEVVVGPPAIQVNAAVEPELCAGDGGQVSWAPTNGDGVYTFTLNGELTTATMAEDLAPGDYTVVVTDGEGCPGEETVQVEAAVPISVVTEVMDASCFGQNDGVITINAEGGSGAYQFSDDGANFISNNQFSGFGAGSYPLFVQDGFGCVESVTAIVGEPGAIVITGIPSEGAFQGEGSIDVTVYGGSLPYEYEWIGPGVSGQATQDLNGISSGSYTVEVIDANGCSAIETFDLVTSTMGCTDPMACNYEFGASEDDGSCDYSCLGCTNPSAFNYNPTATVDDGSCIFFASNCDFIGNAAWAGFAPGLYLGQSQVEHELGVFVNGEFVLHLPGTYQDGDGGSFYVLSWDNLTWSGLPEGVVLGAEPTDAEANTQTCLTYSGTPFEEGVFEVTVTGDLVVSVFGNPVSAGQVTSSFTMVITPNANGILGCTYANASNYLPVATIDDGSCIYAGCMDPVASNFQIFATTDDGSCSYECEAVEGPCMFDANNDGSIGSADLLDFLTAFGVSCE